MDQTIFTQLRFWAIVAFSVLLPGLIYAGLMLKQAISRTSILVFGFILLTISGIDVYLLQYLAVMIKDSPSTLDDRLLHSQISLGLFLLPALFAGLGINMISHVLIRHLDEAERRYDRAHGHDRHHHS